MPRTTNRPNLLRQLRQQRQREAVTRYKGYANDAFQIYMMLVLGGMTLSVAFVVCLGLYHLNGSIGDAMNGWGSLRVMAIFAVPLLFVAVAVPIIRVACRRRP